MKARFLAWLYTWLRPPLPPHVWMYVMEDCQGGVDLRCHYCEAKRSVSSIRDEFVDWTNGGIVERSGACEMRARELLP